MWFQATRTGRFHIFCAEYCGTLHSGMIGWVEVMEPSAYQRWLAGGAEGSLASQGEGLFQKYACNTCHTNDATGRGPVLAGMYGSDVMLNDNSIVKADDNYIRESILNPTAKVVAGYDPVMPTFQGQVTEEQLTQLIAYVRSLGPQGSSTAGGSGGPSTAAATTPLSAQMDANSPLKTAGETKGAAKPPQK
jgi:cytochrome c oxidase subunit 2